MSQEAQHYTPGFIANLQLAPGQNESRLVNGVLADLNHTTPGKLFNADDIGQDDDEEEIVGRAPPSPEGYARHVRRVGSFRSFGSGRFIETLEKVRMLEDPSNTIMASMMSKKKRGTDRSIIGAFFADAREGETGETTVAFPAGQTIAVDNRDFLHDDETVAGSGNLPLTVGKLIKARVMLDQSEIEGERYFACSAVQIGNLLSSTPATNRDYGEIAELASGRNNRALGFTFIRSELLPVASNIRDCAAWVKPAMIYKERPIENAWIERRKDRSGRWYAYYEVERGAVRRYDTGVIRVRCAENVF